MSRLRVFFISCLVLSLAGFAGAAFADISLDRLKEAYKRPYTIPFPKSAPYSPQMATLGKMLFFDPRLSGSQSITCDSCHDPSFGYGVPIPGAFGAGGAPLSRKTPTILNVAYIPFLFWDGRAKSLEDQAAGPITASAEMNGNFPEIIERLSKVAEYKTWFGRLFPGTGVTRENILTAIATFERTIVSNRAPFDRWVEGDEQAIPPEAVKGFQIFNGKAGCSNCHMGWNFTDNQFHDVGVPDDDIGRGKLEPNNPSAQHAFKTPGLRNIGFRAPFGHTGQIADLPSMIAFYESGGVDRPSKSPLIKSFSLSDQETKELLAFLQSLTADKTETSIPNVPNE